jgi:DNA-binding CsgD family transcriptional regulator
VADLTPREREVLSLIAQGKRCRDIAASLGIAVYTVRKHRTNICEKFGLHGTGQLAAFAIHLAAGAMSAGCSTNSVSAPAPEHTKVLTALSERERAVLRLVGQRLSSKEIARHLLISPATVRKHRENISKRLALHGIAPLALLTHLVCLA